MNFSFVSFTNADDSKGLLKEILDAFSNRKDSKEVKKEKDESWADAYDEATMNMYTGNFDFSDENKSAVFVGIEHKSNTLFRDSWFGKLSPITGAFMTGDQATYAYTGVQANYEFGRLNITPSFAPGLYDSGAGKDLGHAIEFRSEVQMSYDLGVNSKLGMSYNHLSNASLGEKNPGANSYVFNFLHKF